MEIKISKSNEEIITKLKIEENKEIDFDYVKLINELSCGNEVSILYEGIEPDTEEKINKMYEEIRSISTQN